jgi:hypothetical protein
MIIGYLSFGAGAMGADKLLAGGCEKIVTGSQMNKKAALSRLIASLSASDVLVFCSLDHLGTTTDLIPVAIELGNKKAHLRIIDEDIDTLRDSTNYLHGSG